MTVRREIARLRELLRVPLPPPEPEPDLDALDADERALFADLVAKTLAGCTAPDDDGDEDARPDLTVLSDHEFCAYEFLAHKLRGDIADHYPDGWICLAHHPAHLPPRKTP